MMSIVINSLCALNFYYFFPPVCMYYFAFECDLMYEHAVISVFKGVMKRLVV